MSRGDRRRRRCGRLNQTADIFCFCGGILAFHLPKSATWLKSDDKKPFFVYTVFSLVDVHPTGRKIAYAGQD